MNKITVSAPGRICLFGEHQDYLNLPVISAAINLRIEVTASPGKDKIFFINLPDIAATEILDFSKEQEFVYSKERDYFKSIFNVLFRKGIHWPQGWNCVVQGKIPINSGTSSSSALNNIWCRLLLEIGDNVKAKWKTPEQVSQFSYLAEVIEFNEPGGKMDQISTAIGGVLHINFADIDKITRLPAKLGSFVLGDSNQPKDTMKILSQTKLPALSAAQKIQEVVTEFSFLKFPLKHLHEYKHLLSVQEYRVMQGMLLNRNICRDAKKIMQTDKFDDKVFGKLLTEHHRYLRDNLKISTPKIEKMLQAALQAGALGGKINGSGGGGCMFAYAPDQTQKVAEAIEKAGGKAYIVNIDEGIKIK